MALSFANPLFAMKYYVKGAVANMHWIIEFIKQVLPMFRRPTGEYPYPLPEATATAPVIDMFVFVFLFLLLFDWSSSSSVSPEPCVLLGLLNLPATYELFTFLVVHSVFDFGRDICPAFLLSLSLLANVYACEFYLFLTSATFLRLAISLSFSTIVLKSSTSDDTWPILFCYLQSKIKQIYI